MSEPIRSSARTTIEVDKAAGSAQRSFVVGTAGHVDHGKSTLVKALTGIDPDRLAEEKARAMTIELGFAWLDLPSGRTVGVVDVPGHERFIKTMLAGVGGIDAALLIIAADEGPMPQTDEHLAILDLLGVRHGVVVLTKADAVEQDWLDLVHEEVKERIAPTTLRDAPIVAVSAMTGDGLPAFTRVLDGVLDGVRHPVLSGVAHLPIDRTFTRPGFGTVVTGTLVGGPFATGQDIQVYPGTRITKIRGLQSHGKTMSRVGQGNRTAVNLASIGLDQVRRGDVLASPGALTTSMRLDALVRLLPAAGVALEQNAEVDVFCGAAAIPARVTLLDRERLAPGDTGWLQLRLREPMAVLKGDRFIVRRPSPSDTIGGGEVVDPFPVRHRRFRPEVLSALETLSAGDPAEIVAQALSSAQEYRSLLGGRCGGLSDEDVATSVARLLARGDVRRLARHTDLNTRPGDYLIAAEAWGALTDAVEAAVGAFHTAFPYRGGMSKEELKRRLNLSPPRLADDALAAMVEERVVRDGGQTVSLLSFAVVLSGTRREAADRFLDAVRVTPKTPPAPVEHGLDADSLGALVERGEVVRVADGVVFLPETVEEMTHAALALLDDAGPLTMARFRDHVGTSRKYAQALLEYLDSQHITRRVGDERVRYVGTRG